MNDKELLKKLMDINGWTQTRLAEKMGFAQGNVSKILAGKQKLSGTSRKVAEMLLTDGD